MPRHSLSKTEVKTRESPVPPHHKGRLIRWTAKLRQISCATYQLHAKIVVPKQKVWNSTNQFSTLFPQKQKNKYVSCPTLAFPHQKIKKTNYFPERSMRYVPKISRALKSGAEKRIILNYKSSPLQSASKLWRTHTTHTTNSQIISKKNNEAPSPFGPRPRPVLRGRPQAGRRPRRPQEGEGTGQVQADKAAGVQVT